MTRIRETSQGNSIVALGFDFQNARELEPKQPLWSTDSLTTEEALVSVLLPFCLLPLFHCSLEFCC